MTPNDAADVAQHDGLQQELRPDARRLAPSALRRPISRVRSVTATSMMFMIPIPATTSAMMPMTKPAILTPRLILLNCVIRLALLKKSKLSSLARLDAPLAPQHLARLLDRVGHAARASSRAR